MMLSVARLRHYLHDFQLEKLFVEELGWDRHPGQIQPVAVDGRTYLLQGLAQKRGVQIFRCDPDGDGSMPNHGARRKIEKQVTKSAYEHLIIFVDGAQTVQIWQWVAREHGQPAKYREYAHHPKHQTGELLVQKLQGIYFPLSEEDAIDLTGTVHKLRDVFDRDSVTKKFYVRFETEHGKFLKFIKGVAETADREWYASLMLNRLMFVYFIQQKAFLDGDQRYLQNRLRMVQERKGKGRFYTFYRYFLLRLFHEGFAQQPSQRAQELEALLGKIPYLNGGLFDVHQLEQKYPEIEIPDDAFEGVFSFFDDFEWTLDTRPLRSGKEINPDVLGYIFEKFVNQKQMGAYYTKEDITEYISKNTIIPFLFDAARKKCAIAFDPDSALWGLVRNDPDRYIYEPVRRGVISENGDVLPGAALPEFVQKRMNDPKARMFDKKYNLGEADLRDAEGRKLTLPTETWREYVNRRKRCLELREKLSRGEIHDINDFITYNLNIRQFAEDAISTCEGSELLRAFYAAISSITVLDPTCGSGAFLFAALNILEPLYEACLVRVEAFMEDMEHSGEKHRPEKFSDFRRELAEIEKHPNRSYFILKSIIIKNLYGVDIMEEAVEICKLRLFLKLVAQVEKVKDLEPLPDIDFNIRAGNTLVGFARLDDVKRTLDGKLGFSKGQVDLINEEAEFFVDRAYKRFHQMQTEYEMNARDFAEAKGELRSRLTHLTVQLDCYLATEYGISESIIPNKKKYQQTFNQWQNSHQPFHWFAEFYGIMKRGGFDVVIGNPPYVEYTRSRVGYRILALVTEECDNLWAFVLERSLGFMNARGRISLITPLSLVSTGRFAPAYRLLASNASLSTYLTLSGDAHPSVLFAGVKMSFVIFTHARGEPRHDKSLLYTSKLYRWLAVERGNLFPLIEYQPTLPLSSVGIPFKAGCATASRIIKKISSQRQTVARLERRSGVPMLYHRIVRHFVKALFTAPYFQNERDGQKKSEDYKLVSFEDEQIARMVRSFLISSTYYLYFVALSDAYHCGRDLVLAFPVGVDKLPSEIRDPLIAAGIRHEADLAKNSVRRRIKYRATGWIEYDEFYPRESKAVADEIDLLLARHYGFTGEELDFIINYDIKYRMGQDSGEDEGE